MKVLEKEVIVMQIREIMKKKEELIMCLPEDCVTEAARKMDEHNIGCVLVTENGILKGIITDRDIALTVAAKGKNPNEVQLKEIMTAPVITGHPEWDLFETTRMMSKMKIRRLPIEMDGKVEGFVSTADLAPALKREMDSFLDLETVAVTH
jgi:CBS domain-containing protein